MLRIGRYIHATKEKGLIYHPQVQSFDLWCDANFSGIGLLGQPTTIHLKLNCVKGY